MFSSRDIRIFRFNVTHKKLLTLLQFSILLFIRIGVSKSEQLTRRENKGLDDFIFQYPRLSFSRIYSVVKYLFIVYQISI